MEIEQDIEEDLDGMENLVNEKGKKELKCKGIYIILIILGNLILIGICILIIHLVAKKKENKISSFFNNYLNDITKLAITPNRIKHLVKSNSENKYQIIVDLEKEILDTTWEMIKLKNQTAIKEIDKIIYSFLFPDDKEIKYGISENLVKILTQKEDYKIYQLLDDEALETLNLNLLDDNNKQNKDLFENKLKAVILYGLINFPMQITYFSKKTTIKGYLIDNITKKLKSEEITNKINHLMEKYDNQTYNLYMVLGSGQEEERKRMTAKVKNRSYINFVNTGLRIKSTDQEVNKTFKDSFENYYINPKYKELMKSCSADGIMDESNYTKFIEGCEKLKVKGNYTTDDMAKLNDFFNNYTFSVETANTIIEYINLTVPLEKIHIIRLGQEYRHKLMNEHLIYNETDVYILFNVYDIAQSEIQDIKRATTEANVKAIHYLRKECPNFLNEDDYNKFILVSSRGNAERQLEAFNIISKIYDYSLQFDAVIWNDDGLDPIDGKKVIEYILESFVKSTNLISNSYVNNNKFNNEIQIFANKTLDLIALFK